MKLLTIATLSASALSTLNTSAFANKIAENTVISRNIVEISPVNLVSAAYQGRFVDQGIPSNGAFLTAVRINRIQAEDLVKVAIASGRLSSQTLENDSYMDSVENVIDNFKRRRF